MNYGDAYDDPPPDLPWWAIVIFVAACGLILLVCGLVRLWQWLKGEG